MTTPNQGLMKKCSICGEIKDRQSEFYQRKGKKDGSVYFSAWCKVCGRKKRAAYVDNQRKTNVLEFNRTQNISKAKNRNKYKDTVYNYYGRKCSCCGETEQSFLSIDHINNDGAEWRKKHFGGSKKGTGTYLYQWLIKNNFPEGFQVLCMNCQWGKRMNNGVCPHQVGRNDYPVMGVGPSGSKRTASYLEKGDEEIVSSVVETHSGLF